MFGTEQVNLLRFNSQVVQSSSSSQCSSQRLLECLLSKVEQFRSKNITILSEKLENTIV